jgi:hypothetical protein
MDDFHKHVLHRLDNLEGELRELREVTWPVCQAQLDNGNNLNNLSRKKNLLKWLGVEEVAELLRLKGLVMKLGRETVDIELRQIVVTP